MVSHHLGMFEGHWSSGSGDMKCLICDVTSQNRLIEVSSNFVVVALHGMSPPC